MSLWLVVWFVVAIVGTVTILVLVAALVRQAMLLGRTAQRFQDEVGPIASDISTGVDRAGTRASSFRPPSFAEQRRGRHR